MSIKSLVLFFNLFVTCFSTFSQTIAMPGGPDEVTLSPVLLRAAMKELGISPTYPYTTMSAGNLSFTRIANDIENHKIDVFWSMTDNQMEERFTAIYIPIFRGLLGMRIPLVRKEHQNSFAHITTLLQFKEFRAGSGRSWADTKIMEYNGIPVVKTLKYQNLFPMLEGGRFDYFPRGIHEPWQEILDRPELNLAVENNILLRYTAPNYFFVAKDRPDLARQLTEGLEKLILSGEFNKLFFADQQVKTALKQANVKNRIVFDIENPTLSKRTPLNRKELWFDPMTGE